MYKPHQHCRSCGYAKPGAQGIKSEQSEKLIEVFDLGIQPLANDFCKNGDEHGGYAPLKVLFCPRCSLGQLSVVVRPEILYRNYAYVTSPSETMQRHFEALHRDISAEAGTGKLLEIGSNDGALLAAFKEWGYEVLGIDPAENLNELSRKRGVESVCDLFNESSAKLIASFMSPDIILARHVFCHVDDWQEFVRSLELLCKKNTIVCIEVPYCGDTLENLEWDTVYHEHLNYLTLRSVDALLKNTSLQLVGLKRYPIHGGAIMLMIRRKDSDFQPDPAVQSMVEHENITAETWALFASKSAMVQSQLMDFVRNEVGKGKTVAALGASAKSTVWINACQFTRREIKFIADTTPQKWFRTSPGTDIPVLDEGSLLREMPDYTLMFCWNFRSEVLTKHDLYRSKGGKFIIPVPKIEVL